MPQEWSEAEIRDFGYRVVDLIAESLTSIDRGPVFRPIPPEVADVLSSTPLPLEGTDADDILADFRDQVLPYPMGNGHRRFWGWVNSPPAVIGIFAEALAAAMDPSVAGGNHAAVHLEHGVLDWFKELFGFPAESAGLLVSGGSVASLVGLAVARHRAEGQVRTEGLQADHPKLCVYVSEEGHSCLRKAAELLGIGSANIRTIAVDDAYRMDVAALESAIEADLAVGNRPVAVAASAGTVNTGAIDPLEAVAEVCARHGAWFHVDGAYGAPAVLTRRYEAELGPLRLADSLAIDPHKWLSVPIEAGVVLVRDAQAMRDAFSLVPPYLRTDDDPHGVGGPVWFSEFGIQQTRGFRALKVWMALRHDGISGYRAAIEAQIELAEQLSHAVEQAADLELVASGLSVACFRYAPPEIAGDDERLDAINRELLRRLQLGGDAFLSSSVLRGRFVLRACIINYKSRVEDIERLVELVRSVGMEVVG
ncbi:MAG TPA: aminotransferase class V-fold PLP-dependent enzyme [Candidatus Dormibacteraeota bacterium]|nr:aminotransferase class V-fold PLP-dependent enzyme [Candidatus Dormibacteraeota bacterium]